jgi:hypothetical protein
MSESKNRCYKTDQGPNMAVLLLAILRVDCALNVSHIV